MSRDQVRALAMDLPPAERHALALELLETTEEAQDIALAPAIEAAWIVEIDRRRAEIDTGKVEMIPWEVVRAELLAEIDE